MVQLLLNFNFFEFICKKILNYFKNYFNLKPLEVEKLYLGIMVVALNISEMMIVLIISFFLGIIKELIVFSIMFVALRLMSAGIHCKSALGCIVTTSITYIGSVYISIKYPLNTSIAFIVSIICTVLLYKYAPADTENRPILGAENRKKLKIKTTIIASSLILINLLLLNKILFNLTMFALLLEMFSVLPWTYKLMKSSYKNYKKYELN
ncbi:MAG: hypothetical protein E7208_10385 [Clostridium butyricum]|nr:hypothetical protein [Clostridium butyricum]